MSQLQPTAGPSTVASRSPISQSVMGEPPKTRHRLTDAGREFLYRFLGALNGREPTLAERKRVLAEIQNLPGCAFYKMTNLNNWLSHHNHGSLSETPARTVEPGVQSSSTRYSTLSEAIQKQLTTLLELERAVDPVTPPVTKMRLWAVMLKPSGADQQEVEDWLRERWEMRSPGRIDKDETKVDPGGRRTGEGKLLTPAGTATPEPEVKPRESPTVNPTAHASASSLLTPISPSVQHSFVAWPPETYESKLQSTHSPPLYPSQNSLPLSPVSPRLSPQLASAYTMNKGMTGNEKFPSPTVDATHSNRTGSLQNTTSQTTRSSNDFTNPAPLHSLIRRGLAEYSRSPPKVETNLPKTAEQFNIRWAEYQHILQKLEQKLDM